MNNNKKLFLTYDKIIKQSSTGYLVILSMDKVANLKMADFQIITMENTTIYASELDENLKIILRIPLSHCKILSEHIMEITDEYYAKFLDKRTISLPDGHTTYFRQLMPLWIRTTSPEQSGAVLDTFIDPS